MEKSDGKPEAVPGCLRYDSRFLKNTGQGWLPAQGEPIFARFTGPLLSIAILSLFYIDLREEVFLGAEFKVWRL